VSSIKSLFTFNKTTANVELQKAGDSLIFTDQRICFI